MKILFLKSKTLSLKSGQTIITAVIFLLFISLSIVAGTSSLVFKEARIARDSVSSKKSYFLAESGAEDLSYRIINGMNYDNQEILELDGNIATTTTIIIGEGKEVTSSASAYSAIRKSKITLTTGEGATFSYGVQIGEGGLSMFNTSLVVGNAFSNGPITGSGSNLIEGGVVSAGPSGSIDGIHAIGTAYAHSITNSEIDEDAYYDSDLSGTTVWGITFPGSPDQTASSMPISDEKISEWENVAASSVISSPCPYVINSDVTIGPVKIECNLQIKGSPTVTLAGMVWVTGDVTIENTATVRLSASLGEKSVAIIADNPSNRTTSSKIALENSATFVGTGTEGTYVLIISMNNSSESGGEEEAVEVEQSVSGDLLVYAPHGEVELQNSVSLKEVTAYKIELQNSAEVVYETGLASLLFETGPGGGYSISAWEEI